MSTVESLIEETKDCEANADTGDAPPIVLLDAVKRCSHCKVVKPLSEFYRTNHTQDGYRYECRACGAAYQRERYHTDSAYRAARLAYSAAYLVRLQAAKNAAKHEQQQAEAQAVAASLVEVK